MKNIHMIANAHLDPVWLWRWEEGCAEALSTFRCAADLAEEFPGFAFCHNESILYSWVEENDPALFRRIQKLVREGRWHIMGGWFLQPDCNMPAGESIVRNILVGRRFFKEKFDARPTTAINFDSFGHSRGLVQILNQAGYDSYLVCRPAKAQFEFSDQDFVWEGFHGSKVYVHRSDENYNSVWGHVAEELKAFLAEKKDEKVTLYLWGVGDHGGGPSRKDLADVTELAKTYPDALRHSCPEDYFRELARMNAPLPVVQRALNPVAPGCYTSQIRIKRKHRRLENELYSAEKMSVAAEIQTGLAYPTEKFNEARRDLLFSEFHDALPGSGSHLVEEDTLRLLDHGLEIVAREKMKSFIALSAGEKKVIGGQSVVMFYNPHPFAIEGDFVCEAGLPKQNWSTDFLYPAATRDGKPVPTQALKEHSNFSLDWRKRVLVHLTLPAQQMTRLDVAFHPLPKRPAYAAIAAEEKYVFDNGQMRVVIDIATGLVDSYAVGGREYLTKGSFALTTIDDSNSPWGIHSKTSHARRQFQLLTPFDTSEYAGVDDRVFQPVRVIEDGDVETVLEAAFGLHDSKAYLRYRLPKKGTHFTVEAGVLFAEKQQTLKLEMNSALTAAAFAGQVMFGRDELAHDGEEAVAQKWVSLTQDGCALAVINDGTYGVSARAGTIGLTLLRSAGYTASDFVMGRANQEDRIAPRMEQGEREFAFRIDAGDAAELAARVDNEALAFNETPYALAYCPSGAGEKPSSLMTIDNPAVVLSALKKAEDGDGYIVRVYQSTPDVQKARIVLAGAAREITLQPMEIRTFRLVSGKLTDETLLEGN